MVGVDVVGGQGQGLFAAAGRGSEELLQRGSADVAAVWLRLQLFPWALTDIEWLRTLLPC
jgi:preprotein translocase subunit SecG